MYPLRVDGYAALKGEYLPGVGYRLELLIVRRRFCFAFSQL